MTRNVIRAMEDGPYLITGPASLVDKDGKETRIENETIALCRCGASQNKPFCDGAHSGIGFKAAEVVVRPDETAE